MLPKFARSSINVGRDFFDKWLENNRCILCFDDSGQELWCQACKDDLPYWRKPSPSIPGTTSVTVGFHYKYPLDRLIQAAKFHSNYLLTVALGRLMPQPGNFSRDSVLFPVPVSTWRLFNRGFNQSRLLTDALNRDLMLAVDEVSIYKRSYSRDQSKLDARQRKANVKNLFGLERRLAMPQHAIIVDDVVTTGATISTIAALLQNNGVNRVDAVSLAAVD